SQGDKDEGRITERDKNMQVAVKIQSLAFERFQNREFQGLEVGDSDIQPEMAKEGRSGIARDYNEI
ncbi:hypothetical protein BB560_006589, partial [Smittium megazygosporum]